MASQTSYAETRATGYPEPEKVDDVSLKTPSEDKDIELGDHKRDGLAQVPTADSVQVVHAEGEKFKQLGWVKMTICLIVTAIALGALSIPSVFATVGMVPGVILCVGLGLISIYTSFVVGQVKLKYPHINHYAEAVRLIGGRIGFEITSVMFVLVLVLILGSHCLTGTIAWVNIVDSPGVCALVFSLVSAILIFILALPPTFSEFAWLGYIDFASILAAIGITIIATGIEASHREGGLASVDWQLWPAPGTTFYQAFLATTNIILAYSFAVCQFSFMNEMAKPQDYVKSIWALGLTEIVIYTCTGGLIYAFVGSGVRSPALLSASTTVTRVAFGVALPVIFVSGSINGIVVGRYILERAFPERPEIRYVKGVKGWAVWVPVIAVQVIVAWVIAEAIPFFNALLGLISSLFISGFTFYFPALFWFLLIKEGKWYSSWHNIVLSVANVVVLIIGLTTLGCGTYASVQDISNQYASGAVRGSFTCDQTSYT